MSATHSPISLCVNDLIALSVQPTSILLNVIYLVLIGTLFWIVQNPSAEKSSKTRGYGLNRLFTHDDFINKYIILYRLAFALLAGALSGNQIYIKCIGIIIKEYSSHHRFERVVDFLRTLPSSKKHGFITVLAC